MLVDPKILWSNKRRWKICFFLFSLHYYCPVKGHYINILYAVFWQRNWKRTKKYLADSKVELFFRSNISKSVFLYIAVSWKKNVNQSPVDCYFWNIIQMSNSCRYNHEFRLTRIKSPRAQFQMFIHQKVNKKKKLDITRKFILEVRKKDF